MLTKEHNLVRLTIPPRSETFMKKFESLQLAISKIAVLDELLAGLIIVLYVTCIQFIYNCGFKGVDSYDVTLFWNGFLSLVLSLN